MTGTTWRLAPKASPCATATLILTPVKAPGPMLAAMPSSIDSDTCASASTCLDHAENLLRVALPDLASIAPIELARHASSATEHASVAVSSASTRMI